SEGHCIIISPAGIERCLASQSTEKPQDKIRNQEVSKPPILQESQNELNRNLEPGFPLGVSGSSAEQRADTAVPPSANVTRPSSRVTPTPMQEARSNVVPIPPALPPSKALGKTENILIPTASVELPNTKLGDGYIIEYLNPDNPKSYYSTER